MKKAVNHLVILIRGLRDGASRTRTVFVPIRPTLIQSDMIFCFFFRDSVCKSKMRCSFWDNQSASKSRHNPFQSRNAMSRSS